ncbi:FecR family protein [Devosia sp. ZB163]|uniref:FecR family protein n=1 Tax=Devosia sp. ZB163 TaxID=3025938 RepID=UPI002360A997|nr:FecR family protein [Devosia sp. ZB163]MDC9824067.1 FecR family protein [Devosia sp. ZB163]
MHFLIWRSPLALALFALTLSPTFAASGTALGVKPSAELESKTDTKVLTVGADVFIGDRVITGSAGLVQIKFTDQTELVVGPNSALLIEDYLLRQDDSAGKFAINALSGTFRFTTGRAPKDRYIITTPTGTIGVRGTSFDFNVDSADTRVLLYHGEAILCNKDKQCVTLSDTCELGQFDMTQSQILGHTDQFKGSAREDIKADFIYAVSQAPLLGQFRVEDAKQCFQRGFERPTNTASLIEGQSGGEPIPDGCWPDDSTPDGYMCN